MNHLFVNTNFDAIAQIYNNTALSKYVDEGKDMVEKWRRMNLYINSFELQEVYEIPCEKISGEMIHPALITAGGSAIPGLWSHDEDHFAIVDSISEFNEIRRIFLENAKEYRENLHVITKGDHQLVKKLYPSIAHVLSNFDVPCCKFAYNYSTGKLYFTLDAAFAYITKTNGSNYKVNGNAYLSRLKKYTERGYKIIAADYTGLLTDIINHKTITSVGKKESGYESFCSNAVAVLKNSIHYYNIFYPHHEKCDKEMLETFKIPGLNTDFNELAEREEKFINFIEEHRNEVHQVSLKRMPSNNHVELTSPEQYYGTGIPHLDHGLKYAIRYTVEIRTLAIIMKILRIRLPVPLMKMIWFFI